ncbi:MAG: DUF488 domain-containing protein, partial [Chloroflexi bacterium]|nr:DUF488 domain-containing protein [Chloroflexota bacterium]
LEDVKHFKLKPDQPNIQQMDMFVRQDLLRLAEAVGKLRGDALVRKTYLEYPFYATRSEAAPQMLSASEFEQVLAHKNTDSSPRLFTIGYEGISIDAYLSRLIAHNVKLLVDVRNNPISRKFGFSKNQLALFTQTSQIAYVHLPELGIPSTMRKNLKGTQAHQNLFNHYANEMLPKQSETLARLESLIDEHQRVALTCFEASHQSCHRSKITAHFENDPGFRTSIEHL